MVKNTAVNKWRQKAQDDLLWTEANLEAKVYYGACFTAQQSAEKIIKAYLLSRGRIIRKIHDLGALLEECILMDQSFEIIREKVLPLVDYYVQTRYPDLSDFIEYSEEKAVQALENAREIFEFINKKF